MLDLGHTAQKETKVEGYEFEPIKGYPMLNWRGKRPFRGTQFYPAQLKESYGDETDGWMNQIFWGDNLQVMSHLLKKYRGQVDLIYIDPPFDSKADYKMKIQLRGNALSNDTTTFEEKQYTDIWNNDEYLQFMYERLVILKELLSNEGCIYLHCDYQKSHHLRCLMDEIFGNDHILNEIIWKRTSARSDSNTFNHIHDTIFIYSKGNNFNFNKLYLPHEQAYTDKYYSYAEDDGRRFATIDATQAGLRNGSSGMVWRGFSPALKGNHWKFRIEQLDVLDNEGRIYWPQKEGGWPRLKSYLEETKGSAIQSLWSDIKAVNSQASERNNYPTQKPSALLERIIEASSNPGDLVFDCFMGSGTTQAVTMKLGRRFLGADINLGAVQTTTKRLIKVANEINGQIPEGKMYTGFQVYNVNHYDVFRNPVEAKELLMKALEVEPAPGGALWDGEKDGRMVKVMPVNRIATKADLGTLLSNMDLRTYEAHKTENPNRPVEQITLICMGHEPDLAAQLQAEVGAIGYRVDVQVVDILRDGSKLEFKRDAEADVSIENHQLLIRSFYPMNLLQKLSLMQEDIGDWKELVESVLIDWNYDGAVLEPATVDIPEGSALVRGVYSVPDDYGTIRVKITDVLSESLELTIQPY